MIKNLASPPVLVTGVIIMLALRAVAAGQTPELLIQKGHTGNVYAVAFSPDGKLLASGSDDGSIILWDVRSRAQIRSLQGRSTLSLSFSPDGRLLASAGDTGTTLWEVGTGTLLKTLAGNSFAVSFSPDGKLLATTSGLLVKMWDVTSGALWGSLEGHSRIVTSVTFSPDGKLLASGSYDKTVKLWDVSRKTEIRSFSHPNDVSAVAFSPDGRLLATGTIKEIKLWNVSNGEELKSLAGGISWVTNTVKFSPDGKFLAIVSKIQQRPFIQMWALAKGTHTQLTTAQPSFITSVAFSPDGKLLASGAFSSDVKLWNLEKGSQFYSLVGNSSPVSSMALSASGKFLASGSFGEDIKLWDMVGGKQLRIIEPHGLEAVRGALRLVQNMIGLLTGQQVSIPSPLLFSPDEKLLASTILTKQQQKDEVRITLSDTATGIQRNTLTGHTLPVTCLAFSPDGKLLVSGSYDSTVKIWDVTSGAQLKSLSEVDDFVAAVAFSPDGKLLASTNWDRLVRLWDVATGKQLRVFKGHSSWINALAFSPDGKLLASGSGGVPLTLWVGDTDKTVRLWDVSSGKQVSMFEGHTAPVNSIAFSPDGKFIASGSRDKTIKLWDITTQKQVITLSGHTDAVTAVAFSPDGKKLISSSVDATIKVWSTDAPTPLASVHSLNKNDWLVTTQDNLFDGSVAAWQHSIWRFGGSTFDYAPVEAFFSEFYYPGLLEELMTGKRPKAQVSLAEKDRRLPQVSIVQTASDAEVLTRTIKVQVEVTEAPEDNTKALRAGGIRDLRLFRNGSLVKVWRGDLLALSESTGCRKSRPGQVICETQVSVAAGENDFTAYAFNRDNVKSNDGEIVIKGSEKLKRDGTIYVLAIGINKYANPNYNLKYAVPDALDFARALKVHQDKLKLYANTEVILLSDQSATKANILLALSRFAKGADLKLPAGAPPSLNRIQRTQPEDAVVIYFAGHGTADHDRFYMIPHDLGVMNSVSMINRRSLKSLHTNSVSDLELEAALESVDAGQLLMVIDACNSGQALEAEEKRRGPMNSKGLAQLAYEKGMYILTAAQSRQAALEVSRLGHGLLTYSMLEGLADLRADTDQNREIWDREWMGYATERVPQIQREEMERREHNRRESVTSNARRGATLVFLEGDEDIADPRKRNVQQPRIFHRRELPRSPFIVTRE